MPKKHYPGHIHEATIKLKFMDGHEEVVDFRFTVRFNKMHRLVTRALRTGKTSTGNGAFIVKILSRREVGPGSREAMF